MAKNVDNYRQRMEGLHKSVGAAVAKWAGLEAYLVIVLTVAIKTNAIVTSQILASVKTFSLALDIIHTAMREALKKECPEGLTFWNSLVEYLRELSGDRNFIAHTPILSKRTNGKPITDSEEEDWAFVDVTVGPSISASLVEDQHQRYMTEGDIQESILDFEEAHKLLDGFLVALMKKDGPLPEKYLKPVSRRRLSRKQRQAAGQR